MLVDSSGDQVSFNTTVGACCPLKGQTRLMYQDHTEMH